MGSTGIYMRSHPVISFAASMVWSQICGRYADVCLFFLYETMVSRVCFLNFGGRVLRFESEFWNSLGAFVHAMFG